jgi:hypothetical protein
MRGRIQILFAFLAALLLGVSCSSWGRQQAAQSSQERGIRWLLEHQNPDGSWGGESDVGRPDEVYADGNIAGTAHVLIQAASALAGQALLEPAAKGDAGCLAAVNKLAAWQLAHPSPRRSAAARSSPPPRATSSASSRSRLRTAASPITTWMSR